MRTGFCWARLRWTAPTTCRRRLACRSPVTGGTLTGAVNTTGASGGFGAYDRAGSAGAGLFYRSNGINRLWDSAIGDVITYGPNGASVAVPLSAPVLATGATSPRQLSARAADAFSVLDFGAKCDGSTDDTTVIQAAMDAAASLNATMNIAPRALTCRAGALYYRANARIRIDGTLKSFGNTTTSLSNYSSANSGAAIGSDIVIEGDSTIDNQMTARGQAHPTACVYFYGGVQGFSLRGVTLRGCGNFPFNLVGSAATGSGQAAHVYVSYVKILGTGNNNSSEFTNCNDC